MKLSQQKNPVTITPTTADAALSSLISRTIPRSLSIHHPSHVGGIINLLKGFFINFYLAPIQTIHVGTSKRNLYTASLAVSLIGVFLLLTENFGAWQDRSSFFGVVEGYVWIGSEKAFPWAQIGILALSACLLFTAYTSFKGYTGPEDV